MALLAVPWAANAQSGCTIRVEGEDSWGDGWNGGSLTIAQGGTTLNTFSLSGSSDNLSITLTTSDAVTFTWNSGSYDSEVTIRIYDGGNTLVYSVTEPSSGLIYTMSSPCPSCLPPTNLTANNITATGMTVSWSDAANNGNYSLSYWTNGGDTTTVSLTDTSYTLTGLNANSPYYFAVVSVCSATDESSPLTGTFNTACGGSTCDITLVLGSTNGYTDPFTYYGGPATVELFQNGFSIGAYSSSTHVSVCSTDTVIVKYNHSAYSLGDYYDNFASIVVQDGGGTTVYNGGMGDTLCTIAIPCPTCIPPTALFVDSVDQTNVTIGWTPRSGASLFAVYQNDSLVSGTVTDSFFTFTALTANSQYSFGVQAICSSDDSSNIANISTRTSCGPTELPFFVDFEDAAYNGAWYPCWDSTIHAGTDPSVNDQPGGTYNPTQHTPGGTYAMYLQGNSSQNYNLVVGPEMNAVGNMINVSFWAMISSGWIKAGVITNPHDTTTFIPMVTITSGGWTEYEFNTSTLDATANYRIAWLAYGTGYIGKFDDVSVSVYSGCARPATANVDSITAHTAVVTWNAVNGATTYNVYYGTVNDVTASSVNTLVVNDTTVTLNGLNGQTTYYAWVTTACGSNESDFRPTGSFTTLISCPRVTDLTIDTTTSDGATIHWTTGGTETEWYVVIDSNEIGTVYDTFYTFTNLEPMTGHTVQVRAVCDAGDTSAVRNISFATACADPVCNMTVEMTDSYGDGWNNGAVNLYQVGIQVGSATLNSGSNGTATIEVCSSAAVEVRVTSGSYPSEMSFVVRDGGGNAVYTATQGSISASSNGTVLTTVTSPCPECTPPTNIHITNITADGATLCWTAQDGQNSWIVRIDSTDYNVTDTSYNFSGLQARTSYTVSVATDCNVDTSMFVDIQFTTDCSTGSCDITVDMADSYGDGWNGNSRINFYQNGLQVGTAKLASGSTGTATVNVCSGIPVSFSWQTGSYDDEDSYVIYDGGGAEIYNSATSGVNHGDSVADACPSCMTPDSLVVTFIDSNDLAFAWRVIDSVGLYLISFNGGAWEVNTLGTYYTNGLNPNTTYTFSVKAVCQPGDTSNARTITVKTACGQMVLPYVESFENDAPGSVPTCWTVVTPGYNGYPAIDNETPHTGNNSLSFCTSSGSSMIASSAIPLHGDSIYVSFWANVSNSYVGTLEAGVMTNPLYDTTFIPLLTVPAVGGYTRYEFNTSSLSNYYDSTFYLAFRHTNSANYYYVNIDDINIRLDEGCMYPSNLTAVPTTSTLDLTWSANGVTMGNYVVQNRVVGNTVWDSAGTTTDTTFSITGLTSATNYEIRVGLICGADTLWTNIYGTTDCGLFDVPYIENFYSATMDVPPCWNFTDPTLFHFNNWVEGPGIPGHSEAGDGTMMAGTNSAYEYAILPEFNASFSKLQISFKAKLGNISEGDSMVFGVYDDATGQIHVAGKMANPNQSRENSVVFTYNYLNYYGSGNRIAISHTHNQGSGMYAEWGFEIDSLVVIELPDCFPPINITAHNTMYPYTAGDVYFTWSPQGEATEWQVYMDTITSTVVIDSLPDSLFITVNDTMYQPDYGQLDDGAKYRFFVRSSCGNDMYSSWVELQNGVATDEVWMNNTGVADTVTGCDFIVYDNGGPIAGYLHNSNSKLVIRTLEDGRQPQIQEAKIKLGAHTPSLSIYDGTDANGTALFSLSTVNIDTVINVPIATSTTGALTVVFTSGYAADDGYELYVHCIGSASCPKPTNLIPTITGVGDATITWNGTASSYNVYYKESTSTTWTMQNVTTNSISLTGLVDSATYNLYVVALCSATDSSVASNTLTFAAHFDVVIDPCDPATDLSYSDVTTTTAVLDWVSNGSEWQVEVKHLNVTDTLTVNTKPYTLTNLLPTMQYNVRVRTVCSGLYVEPYSDWSNTVTFTTQTPQSSINDVEDGMLAIYPNPASTVVSISVAMDGMVSLSLVDMNGRTVYSHTGSDGLFSIDVSTLAKGAYFVRVVGEQATSVRKLIVR